MKGNMMLILAILFFVASIYGFSRVITKDTFSTYEIISNILYLIGSAAFAYLFIKK